VHPWEGCDRNLAALPKLKVRFPPKADIPRGSNARERRSTLPLVCGGGLNLSLVTVDEGPPGR
jgi:hypothetical protein